MEDGGLPAMASAALAELRKTARLEGAAIIDIARPDSASVLLFDAAPGVPDAIGSAHQMLRALSGRAVGSPLGQTNGRSWQCPGSYTRTAGAASCSGGNPARRAGTNGMPISPRQSPV